MPTMKGRKLVATASVPVLETPDPEAKLVTEVVVGETVEVANINGADEIDEPDGWLPVVVPGHPTRLDKRGYPGWVRPQDFIPADGWTPTHRVAKSNFSSRNVGLPLGAMVELREDALLLPGGLEADVSPGSLLPLGEADTRSAVEISYEFSGLPYRWGGTDSLTGSDCSGLVYRVMRLLGVEVPRDADDQFEHAPFKSRDDWKEARAGDLVFFGAKAITHVGFYLADETYLSEHGSGGTLVRGMEEDPYLGYARYLQIP